MQWPINALHLFLKARRLSSHTSGIPLPLVQYVSSSGITDPWLSMCMLFTKNSKYFNSNILSSFTLIVTHPELQCLDLPEQVLLFIHIRIFPLKTLFFHMKIGFQVFPLLISWNLPEKQQSLCSSDPSKWPSLYPTNVFNTWLKWAENTV